MDDVHKISKEVLNRRFGVYLQVTMYTAVAHSSSEIGGSRLFN